MRKQARSPSVVVAAVLSAVTVLGAQGAWAVFNDGGGSPFVDEISEIGNAGCASGFPDGGFHPRDDVKRQQFAYWTANCGGRARSMTFTGGVTQPTLSTEFQMAFRTPGVGGNQGYLLVTATVAALTSDGANCPCHAQLETRVSTSGLPSGTSSATVAAAESPATGNVHGSMTTNHVFAVPTGIDLTVRVLPTVFDADVSGFTFTGEVSALYVPVDGTPTVG
jgi:hypothetical protein